MGHEPSCSPRKKARREASGVASKASKRSLEQTKFPRKKPAAGERVSALSTREARSLLFKSALRSNAQADS